MEFFVQNKPVEVQSVVNWLYFYKPLNLTLSDHKIVKYVFNGNNLGKIIEWLEKTNANEQY